MSFNPFCKLCTFDRLKLKFVCLAVSSESEACVVQREAIYFPLENSFRSNRSLATLPISLKISGDTVFFRT